MRRSHLIALLSWLLLPAASLADCSADVDERARPSAPCIDHAAGQLFTPRLDWAYEASKPPEAVKAEMARVAALLGAHPEVTRVVIESHEAYTPGRKAYGMRVTDRRADALRRLLIEAGVDPARIESRGFGEDRPLFDTRDPAVHPLNHRFEWHLTLRPPAEVDRAALRELGARWRRCFEGTAATPGITLLTDPQGRLATVVLDRPGPLRCMATAIGHRLTDGPARIRWPAPDRPAPFPPPPIAAPTVEGWRCTGVASEKYRPARACISPDGTRIWMPPLPRHPKSNVLPTSAYGALDALVELLRAAPQIARLRIEMHDPRDPHARERAVCHACRRAAAVGAYLRDHGIARDRLEVRGCEPGRCSGQAAESTQPHYALHIEGWMPERVDTSAPVDLGEERSQGAEAAHPPKGKIRQVPTP